MPLIFPDLKQPLGGVTACASRITLDEHPELDDLASGARKELIAETEGGCARLLHEKSSNGNLHFHLDYYAKFLLAQYTPNCQVDDILHIFERLNGKVLSVNFESKFKLSKDELSHPGLVNLIGGVGVNFGGISGSITSASVRLNDSVYREIRWKQSAPTATKTPDYLVEILGSIGSIPFTDQILNIAADRAKLGLDRFVLAKAAARVVKNK